MTQYDESWVVGHGHCPTVGYAENCPGDFVLFIWRRFIDEYGKVAAGHDGSLVAAPAARTLE